MTSTGSSSTTSVSDFSSWWDWIPDWLLDYNSFEETENVDFFSIGIIAGYTLGIAFLLSLYWTCECHQPGSVGGSFDVFVEVMLVDVSTRVLRGRSGGSVVWQCFRVHHRCVTQSRFHTHPTPTGVPCSECPVKASTLLFFLVSWLLCKGHPGCRPFVATKSTACSGGWHSRPKRSPHRRCTAVQPSRWMHSTLRLSCLNERLYPVRSPTGASRTSTQEWNRLSCVRLPPRACWAAEGSE